jgi:hypothetical protein
MLLRPLRTHREGMPPAHAIEIPFGEVPFRAQDLHGRLECHARRGAHRSWSASAAMSPVACLHFRRTFAVRASLPKWDEPPPSFQELGRMVGPRLWLERARAPSLFSLGYDS